MPWFLICYCLIFHSILGFYILTFHHPVVCWTISLIRDCHIVFCCQCLINDLQDFGLYLSQSTREWRKERQLNLKSWDWVDCVLWWRLPSIPDTQVVYYILLSKEENLLYTAELGGRFVAYSWMRRKQAT